MHFDKLHNQLILKIFIFILIIDSVSVPAKRTILF